MDKTTTWLTIILALLLLTTIQVKSMEVIKSNNLLTNNIHKLNLVLPKNTENTINILDSYYDEQLIKNFGINPNITNKKIYYDEQYLYTKLK